MRGARLVPPAPEVLAHLYMEYLRNGQPVGLTFRQYLGAVGFSNRAEDVDGMDDAAVVRPADDSGPELISVPAQQVTGNLQIIVLLIDFPDQPGVRQAQEYDDLLFSSNVYPTGSLRDFYREVSCGKVDVTGTVHGWIRLPNEYTYYTNNRSGTGNTYPRNAQRMAEDAIQAALSQGITFPTELDRLGNGTITGLFLVHSGCGAEVFPSLAEQRKRIWSHKWNLKTAISVRNGLAAATYLTVPEDCKMGVCAHELGHLVFQWEDFYDPNGREDGQQWEGSGRWDLMAGGSWNGNGGSRPAHPVGLHKLQHGWIDVETITETKANVAVPALARQSGKVLKVVSPVYAPGQFLLVENRRRVGFDDALPGQGLLVWRVDLEREMTAPDRPALQLVQADGRSDLESSINQGDMGDPFPGSVNRLSVDDALGPVSTSFPNGPKSGITLSSIAVNNNTGAVTLNVTVQPATAPVGVTTNEPAMVAQEAAPPLLGAALDRVLAKERITSEELVPFARLVTLTPGDFERRVMAATARPDFTARLASNRAKFRTTSRKSGTRKPPKSKPKPETKTLEAELAAAQASSPGDFGGWWWEQYKWLFNVQWDKQGKFRGTWVMPDQVGEREYIYTPNADDPFRFVRENGSEIVVPAMRTDLGSVPRLAWLIPDINPWAYRKAYLIHDWGFLEHHCKNGETIFEEANLALAEAIYTLMMTGEVDADWRKIEMVYQAVSSWFGRRLWDRSWDADECAISLPG